jgi:dihydrofolate reductase
MAKLIYSVITSLDGYTADADGTFDWAEPDEQVHQFVNDLERPIGTHLYGRRMYQVMLAWETADSFAVQTPVGQDYAAIWQQAQKVVYSTTLEAVSSKRTRIERTVDTAAIQALKESASRDISIGGPGLAAHALGAGLVDECHLFVMPVVVGGGTRAFPDHLSVALELLGEDRFDCGAVHLHYGLAT